MRVRDSRSTARAVQRNRGRALQRHPRRARTFPVRTRLAPAFGHGSLRAGSRAVVERHGCANDASPSIADRLPRRPRDRASKRCENLRAQRAPRIRHRRVPARPRCIRRASRARGAHVVHVATSLNASSLSALGPPRPCTATARRSFGESPSSCPEVEAQAQHHAPRSSSVRRGAAASPAASARGTSRSPPTSATGSFDRSAVEPLRVERLGAPRTALPARQSCRIDRSAVRQRG